MTELEKQMAELMKSTAQIDVGVKDAKKSAAKTRRRSRDLENTLADMQAGQQGFASIAEKFAGRIRRKSKDFNDDDLREIFNKIDEDKSGKLGREELIKAFKEADPTAKPEQVDAMVKFADKNGDGEIDFEEFKIALTTKPEEISAAPSEDTAESEAK